MLLISCSQMLFHRNDRKSKKFGDISYQSSSLLYRDKVSPAQLATQKGALYYVMR